MKALFSLISIFAIQVHGLCDFPCAWQGKHWRLAADTNTELNLPSSSRVQFFVGGSVVRTVECFTRQGPFIMTRIPGTTTYTCINVMYSDEDVFTLRLLPFVSFPGGPPEFCSFCSQIDDTSNMEIWVDIGCNIPKSCPSGPGDAPCTGCEEGVPDDGYCCSKTSTDHQSQYDQRYQYPSYDMNHPGK